MTLFEGRTNRISWQMSQVVQDRKQAVHPGCKTFLGLSNKEGGVATNWEKTRLQVEQAYGGRTGTHMRHAEFKLSTSKQRCWSGRWYINAALRRGVCLVLRPDTIPKKGSLQGWPSAGIWDFDLGRVSATPRTGQEWPTVPRMWFTPYTYFPFGKFWVHARHRLLVLPSPNKNSRHWVSSKIPW